jgi:hypothetical protein
MLRRDMKVARAFGLLLLLFCAASCLIAPRPAHASFAVGVGGGALRLPANDGDLARAAPEGETKGSLLLFWSGTANAGLCLGASYSGYRLTKDYPDTLGTIQTRWSVSQFSAYFEYRRTLGQSPTAPSAAARIGASIVPIKVEASLADSLAYDQNDEVQVGPYIGADLRVPLGQTRFALFASAAKTFVNSTLLREDMAVGPFVLGAGVTYVFRQHFERPSDPPRPSPPQGQSGTAGR